MLQTNDGHSHIVFIDFAVDDYPSLVKGVVSGAEVIVLTPTQDGVTQISEILANRLDIATVHIVSHGSPGCLYLGNTQLSLDTLERYVTQLRTWFSGLLPQEIAPSLLLYGCNVAAGDAGEEFVERLYQLTSAHIAASASQVGHAALGGHWDLEVTTGRIDVPLALQKTVQIAYQSVFGQWLAQGPAPVRDLTQADFNNIENIRVGNIRNNKDELVNEVTGAIHTVLAHPTNPDILYVGTVNGGIWQTTNATAADGPTWKPLTDKLPSNSIGAMAFDPTDPTFQTIIVGIGRFSVFGGNGGPLTGLLLITNGGNTVTPIIGNPNRVEKNSLIGRTFSGVAKHGNLILATANSFDDGAGLYRSTDNGKNWEFISGTNGLDAGASFDLVDDPSTLLDDSTNNDRFYVSVQGKGIYRSNDGGANWENISKSDTTANGVNNAITNANNDNTEMSVASNGRLYVGVVNSGKLEYIGYFDPQISDWIDIGSTDKKLPPANLHPGGQGKVHFSILADPTNPNLVYVRGDASPLFRGTVAPSSGSTTWDSLAENNTARNSAPHPDSREMVFDTINNTIIQVDDGGVYRLTNPQVDLQNPNDPKGDWFSLIGNLQVSELHDIAYDARSKVIIGGAQDNGTPQQAKDENGTSQTVWGSILGADGADVGVDTFTLADKEQSIRYFGAQNGDLRRQVFDKGNNPDGQTVQLLPLKGGGFPPDFIPQFVTPIAVNAIAPPNSESTRLVIGGLAKRDNKGNVILDDKGNVSQRGAVYEATNTGTEPDPTKVNWTPIQTKPGLVDINTLAYGGKRNGVDNPDVLYASSNNQVFVRTDAGGALNPTEALIGAGFITDIVLDPNDWMTAFAIDNNQVFQTTSAGLMKPEPPKPEPHKEVWANITNNLQSIATKSFTTDLKLQPTDLDLNLRTLEYISKPGLTALDSLVVGTNFGVFSSNRGSDFKDWFNFGTDLPNAPVWDLDYDLTDDVLVAGTLGRGAWSLPKAGEEALSAIKTIKVDTLEDVDDNNFDIGDVSLREAIRLITPGGTVNFAPSLTGGTIELTNELVINKDLTIDGLGADKLTISGMDASRVFNISNGDNLANINVEIKGLTIAKGKVSGRADLGRGGGISNFENLTINNSTIKHNNADDGGGVFNRTGMLTINNSTFEGNTVRDNGGGINNRGQGTVTLINSEVKQNKAGDEGGGIANEEKSTLKVLDRSTISGNTALGNPIEALNVNSSTGVGGGIINNEGSTLEVNDSTISGNTATLNLENKFIKTIPSGTSGLVLAEGGGIFNGPISEGLDSVATVSNTTISGNTAGDASIKDLIATLNNAEGANGGGVSNRGVLTVTGTTISSGNTAGDEGGGIFNSLGGVNSKATVTNSTVKDNKANDGGGISNEKGMLTVIGSTISGNTATDDAGGIQNSTNGTLTVNNSTISGNTADDDGGGIENEFGTLMVNDTTINNNTAGAMPLDRTSNGGGISTQSGGTINNTIIAGNIDKDLSGILQPDVSGSFTNTSSNLIGDGTGSTGFTNGVNGNQVGTSMKPIDPKLGGLQDNGGLTQTHALLQDSLAIDKGNNTNIPADITTDQRGQSRIIGSTVDIGAFEAPLPTGSGGRKTFTINRNDGKTIADFGGIGTGSNPSAAVRAEVDTLKFVGSDLTARNLLLTQNGADLEITFEGVADTKVTLQNFPLENLENLTDLGNILFNGQNSIQDSFDVVNADFNQSQIFNRNTVTFLNDLNNDILGFDNSNDVINGQGGDDIINGLSGNDLLRGGEGRDFLFGGTGSDTLVGGFGDDFLDLGVDRAQDTVVYRNGDGSDTVRNFNRGRGGDLLDFQNIPAIDVAVSGNSTFFRLSDGIQGNEGFGTDDPFLRLSGTTGFTSDNLGQNLVAGNTTQFLFS